MAAKELPGEVRIDKWLWAVRLFKTRSIATEACKKGRISMKGIPVKPARTVKVGDVVEIRIPPITHSFEVLALSEQRMNAKLVPEFMKNVTTPDQLEILALSKISGFVGRDRGTGRPTKKERRDLDSFTQDLSLFEDLDLDDE